MLIKYLDYNWWVKLFEKNKPETIQELNFEEHLKWAEKYKILNPLTKEEIEWLLNKFPSNSYKDYNFVFKDSTSITDYSIKSYDASKNMYGISLGTDTFHIHIEKCKNEYYYIVYTTKLKGNKYKWFVCYKFKGLEQWLNKIL